MKILRRNIRMIRLFWALLLISGILGCENKLKIQRGAVGGKVLDQLGNRVPGATITSHRSLFSATTGADGRYHFTSLDSGTHQLRVEQKGFRLATRTVKIEFGSVTDSEDFVLTALPNMIVWNVFSRTRNGLIIDVYPSEPMSVIAVYDGKHFPHTRTAPTAVGTDHRIELRPLIPDTNYRVTIKGTTPDGRKFQSETRFLRPVPTGDIPGPPPAPKNVRIAQTTQGPKFSWSYLGADPLKGFRIFRSVGDGAPALWRDESILLAALESVVDDQAPAGNLVRYSITAVDLDDEVSSATTPIGIISAGTLSGDLVWHKSWSPIDLAGDITVPRTRNLVIEPGVVVRVSETDHYQGGYNPNIVEMTIEGRLVVQGSSAEPVRFISASALPTASDWAGIRLATAKDGREPHLISHLDVMNAAIGLGIRDASVELVSFTARHCDVGLMLTAASGTVLTGLEFEECNTGFLAEGTINCEVTQLRVRGGRRGIHLRSNRGFKLRNSDSRDTTEAGILLEELEGCSVKGCIFVSKHYGMLVRGKSSDLQYNTIDAPLGVYIDGADQPLLRNNIISNTAMIGVGIGIEDRNPGRSYPYNNIFGFRDWTRNCDQLGAPILNVNPEFTGTINGEPAYRIPDSSLLKTGSDRGTEMGAYGWSADL